MAHRPSRTSCAPAVRFGLWLFSLSFLGIFIGCGRNKEAPAVAVASNPKSVAADERPTQATENQGVAPALLHPAMNPAFDPTPIPDSRKPSPPPAKGSG